MKKFWDSADPEDLKALQMLWSMGLRPDFWSANQQEWRPDPHSPEKNLILTRERGFVKYWFQFPPHDD